MLMKGSENRRILPGFLSSRASSELLGVACIVCQCRLSHSLPEIGLGFLLARGYVAAMAVTSEIATRCASSILPDRISRKEEIGSSASNCWQSSGFLCSFFFFAKTRLG